MSIKECTEPSKSEKKKKKKNEENSRKYPLFLQDVLIVLELSSADKYSDAMACPTKRRNHNSF